VALAVELYFDARTEERIDALREELHAAGVERAPELVGSRPHISLAVVETDDAVVLAQLVTAFAQSTAACSVRLGALSSFASRQGVLYLAPVPTMALLELHWSFHARLVSAGLESRPLYQPGAWIPHCTLDIGMSGSQLATAFDVCWRTFTPMEGKLVAAGVVSFPPARPHCVISLQHGDRAERSAS
jgi:hypothetical protein